MEVKKKKKKKKKKKFPHSIVSAGIMDVKIMFILQF